MSLRVLAIFCLIFVQQSLCDDNEENIDGPTIDDPHVLNLLAYTGKRTDAWRTDNTFKHEFVDIEFDDPLQKRSITEQRGQRGKRLRIRAFGENIELWLRPKDATLLTDQTAVYYSNPQDGEPGNVVIGADLGIMSLVGFVLEDPRHLASLVMSKDKLGRPTFNGQIGTKNLGIVSFSDPIGRTNKQNRVGHAHKTRYHVIYKVQSDVTTNILGEHKRTPVKTKHLLRNTAATKQNNRTIPQNSAEYPPGLYPEILLVVDWSIYKKQKHNLVRFLEYIMAFVNGIDLKYRVLKNPSVRLRISGILIAERPRGLPYMAGNMIKPGVINYDAAMDSSATFFYEIRESIPLESYDIAITITRLLFGVGEDATVRGSSFQGSACINRTGDLMLSSALIRDNGIFSGIYTAAHELGHVLGMLHDTPENENCKYREGYIMAEYPEFNINSIYFSKCSLQNLQNRLHNGQLKCLYNSQTKPGRVLPHIMPGRLASHIRNCWRYGYYETCGFNTHKFCLHLHCQARNGTCVHFNEATLEGTRCSKKGVHPRRFCVHGRCIHVPKG